MRVPAISRVLFSIPTFVSVPFWTGCSADGAARPGDSTGVGSSGDESSSGTTSAAGESSDAGSSTSTTYTGSTTTSGGSEASDASTSTESESSSGASGGDEESSSTGEAVDPAAEFFTIGTIAQIDLVLGDDAIADLNDAPKEYVHGDLTVTLDGVVTDLPNVAVRLKGNYGSLRTLQQKAGFLINTDKYVDDQTLFGVEKLALNNMVQDPSMQREALAYRLFREGGVPAPRASHAVVTVNGELYGLYTTVESTDNTEFLEHWFGDDEGSLYEGAYGSDLYTDWVGTFDQDNGDDVGFADLTALSQALDAMNDPDTFVEDVSAVVDLDLFLAFAATELYLGHWDGYSWTRNNYYLYRKSDGRWVFMPWGLDQTFGFGLDPFGGGGRLAQLCDASLPCRQLLAAQFEQVVERVAAIGLPAQAASLASALHEAADADPRKEYGIDTVDAYVAANAVFLAEQGQIILDQLVCADPSAVDEDGDGYSGCGMDCNDGDDAVHPGATEVCDLDDDNCNGVWDDDPMCPQCELVAQDGGGTLAFCFAALQWSEAEADCVTQGGHLVSIHDDAEQASVVEHAFAIAGDSWWIGANDGDVEGTFVWTDGSAMDFVAWAGGEPNDSGGEDCGHLAAWAGGAWNDQPCYATARYVCELP